jgi:hypothetical protein
MVVVIMMLSALYLPLPYMPLDELADRIASDRVDLPTLLALLARLEEIERPSDDAGDIVGHA